MTDDLDNLRPEVREALEVCTRGVDCVSFGDDDAPQVIRAELLRLTKENARLSGRMCLVCGAANDAACPQRDDTFSPCTFDPSPVDAARDFLRRATKAEAELAALKARIAEAKTVQWIGAYCGETAYAELKEPRTGYTRYALVKVED